MEPQNYLRTIFGHALPPITLIIFIFGHFYVKINSY